MDGVKVIVGLGVQDGVNDGVQDGVSEGVSVADGVRVGNEVQVGELVVVVVGVNVEVGVVLAVPVTIKGVRLRVGVRGVMVTVAVDVIVGVKSEAFGASATAIQPMQ
jgi:hypothetical protein